MDQVQDAILSLAPESNRQRALSDELKGGIRRLIEQRWTLIEESAGSLNLAFLAVLVIWLMLIFASFGYNAPRNGLVAVTFVLCAASIAIALFLIVEMDRPFDGLIKISPAPLQTALAHLRE